MRDSRQENQAAVSPDMARQENARAKLTRALALYEPSVAVLERTLGLNHPFATDALCEKADSLA